MNNHKMYFDGQIHDTNNGIVDNSTSNFMSQSSHFIDIRQPQHLVNPSSQLSSSIVSNFGSSPPTVSADFSMYGAHIIDPCHSFSYECSKNNKLDLDYRLLYPSSGSDGFSAELAECSDYTIYQNYNSQFGSARKYPTSCGNLVPCGTGLSNKTRIRWNTQLHEKFVECVNLLGGADKATPKAILKQMNIDGLTIFHVKSHLQKYRIAKHMPETSAGKLERKGSLNDDASRLDIKAAKQLKDALQLQLDVQRRLHEQLEIQRNLQLRIEEQAEQLKIILDQQKKTRQTLSLNQNIHSTSDNDHDVHVSSEGSQNPEEFL